MATQPVLAGSTLAHPSEYKERRTYRGGVLVMADGTQVTDLVQSSAKRIVTLTWNALTAAEKTTLETAFDAIKNTSGSFTDPNNNTFTVTRDGDTELEFSFVLTPNGFRYATSLTLREV